MAVQLWSYDQVREEKKSRGKTFLDQLHGHIHMPAYCVEMIDTPQFQRLRDLKQLGTTYLVFPGASHNRFEHSIGTSYLAGAQVQHLQRLQPELGINHRDLKLAHLAGLCHDLGHGPFSHAFESWIKKRCGTQWDHEIMSQRLLDYLIEDNHIDIEQRDVDAIKDLIEPSEHECKARLVGEDKLFLYDIVNNERNSIDVDKFDYMRRDTVNTGMKGQYDFWRVIQSSRVIDNQICYNTKASYMIYQLFHTRYSLHKQVYQHHVGKAIEYMINDALDLADDYLEISKRANDVKRFTYLTDTVLKEIEHSTCDELKEARSIVLRIRRRQLYRCCADHLFPSDHEIKENISERDVVEHAQDKSLKEEDILVHNMFLNYAKGEQDPVTKVGFFNEYQPNQISSVRQGEVSLLIPQVFHEKRVRVFVRDPRNYGKAQVAWSHFLTATGHEIQRANSLPPSPMKAQPNQTYPRASAVGTSSPPSSLSAASATEFNPATCNLVSSSLASLSVNGRGDTDFKTPARRSLFGTSKPTAE